MKRAALPALSPSLARINPHVGAPRARRPRKPVLVAVPREPLPAGAVVVEVPGLLTKSEANQRAAAHWARTHRTEAAHAAVSHAMAGVVPPRFPLRVCLTRRAPGELDDDNCAGALKGCRDAVAAALGVDDRDPRVVWRVAQERTRAGVYGVRITLAPTDGRASVVAGEAADVVTARLTRDEAGDLVTGLLDRRGGHARVVLAGLVLDLTIAGSV